MKKIKLLPIFLVAVIFFSIFVLAGNLTLNKTKIPKNISKKMKNLSSEFEEFEIPPAVEKSTRIIFGIKSKEKIYLDRFLVLWALWVSFFIVLATILKSTFGLFEGKTKQILGSIFITLLISVLGIFNIFANFLFNFRNSIKFLSKLGPFSILLLLSLFVIIIFLAKKVSHYLEQKQKLLESRARGARLGRLDAYTEAREKAMLETDKALKEP